MAPSSRERRPSAVRSRGRGVAAAFGFLLLLIGLIGGGVLFVLSMRRHDKAVESFARAPVGCTTTLEFSETGTFYVFEETTGSFEVPEGGCVPSATENQPFAVRFVGSAIELREDRTLDYDTGEFAGRSIAVFDIDQPGNYELAVQGDDVDVRAAVGRDPSSGVDEMRNGAIAVAVAGVVLGGLLLALAGRRSKRAATPSIPDGPGWGHRPGEGVEPAWPPAPPRVPQIPVNPHQPDTPAEVAPPPPPLPARAPSPLPPPPWDAPAPGSAPVDTTPPGPAQDEPRPPFLPPKLPE